MYIEDFRNLVTRLESDLKESEKYLDTLRSVDYAFSEMVSENKYSQIHAIQNDYLLKFFLDEELFDWVTWYLYEKSFFDDNYNAEYNGIEYTISGIDSFVVFAEQALGLKHKPIV